MSHSRLDPFASNTGFNTRRDSARSTRPPSFTSTATATPTYTSSEPRADYLVQSIQPPTYASNTPAAAALPPYTPSGALTASAHHHRTARVWDSPDTDSVFDQAEESSLTDADSAGGTSAEATRLGDSPPRYSEPEFYHPHGFTSG
jgi:hypothetical protein